ncbi:TetR-family transcriptional regulator [Streptomyces clavuligerus]|nr:TetR-family transcriptional regulator [Streptomyces clavuligerus]
MWARPQRQRREQPSLSREQIVAESIALLDEEGLDALSMRKLGTRLNAGATSMYSHVSSKDELIELTVDEIYREIEIPPLTTPDDWRAAAWTSAHSLRTAVLRHPWIASVLGEVSGASLGPNMLRMSEGLLTLFEEGGFDPDGANTALGTLFAYVLGQTTSEAAWLTKLARSGQSEEEWMARMLPAAEAAVRPFPRLRGQFEARMDAASQQIRGSDFDLGLDVVLDGLAALRARAV